MVGASIGNGGKVYEARLVKQVKDPDGNILVADTPVLRGELIKTGIDPKAIETVCKGMWKAVNEADGTAIRAKSEIVEIAGKTGTAQTGILKQPTNAWFIAFAPYKNPKYAISVHVENGSSGGSTAAPIAKRILELVTRAEKLEKPEVVPLQEAVGHLNQIEKVEFE